MEQHKICHNIIKQRTDANKKVKRNLKKRGMFGKQKRGLYKQLWRHKEGRRTPKTFG